MPDLSPLDQADAELVLEFLDLHAERRLADRAGLRRMAEMARFCQSFEIAELPKRHHGDKAPLMHSYKEIRFEIIMAQCPNRRAEPATADPVQTSPGAPGQTLEQLQKESYNA